MALGSIQAIISPYDETIQFLLHHNKQCNTTTENFRDRLLF